MKKKLLALTLALTMVLGTGSVVLASDAHTEANLKTPAVVTGAAEYSNSENSTSGELTTDISMTIDKYAIRNLPKTYDTEETIEGRTDSNSKDNMKYIVKYTNSEGGNISVTVPMYVCMYAYGGDGTVTVPDADSYSMSNSSTKTVSTEITEIYPYYKVTEITKAEDVAGLTISGDYNLYGTYGFYNANAGTSEIPSYVAVSLDQCPYNSTDKVYYYKGEKIEDSVTVYDATYDANSDTLKTLVYKVGSAYPGKDSSKEGRALRVTSIKATPAGDWEVVDGSADLIANQFKMSINGLDLAAAAKEALSTDRDSDLWTIKAPTLNEDDGKTVKEAGTLALPITASIAGKGVNKDGHVSVVKVSYTIGTESESTTED